MDEIHHFIRVDFHHFKAFEKFSLHLRSFNILVGPNNSGKSTILAAFRILHAGLRKAFTRKCEFVQGPHGMVSGYVIDLSGSSVAEENIFYNYDDSESASVLFSLSNKNKLHLYFPERGVSYLIPEANGLLPKSPSTFKKQFNCQIGFVPILGPVEHHEPLYQEEAARRALFNYISARNFRNIWHYYPKYFEEFRNTLKETWPEMDIEPPVVDTSSVTPRLYMFCPEERIPREIYWAGFGFQVWCQMLTHLVQSRDKSIFLIDEPDIYLHANLQRQLVGLLRELGPDILIATHSTEIITEAEPDDIVLIDKKRRSARRIKNPGELSDVFTILGSTLNPVFTQLAKTRRAIFVEGKDFQIIAKFARKLGYFNIANRVDFAVIPIQGFNPERIRNLKDGIEKTLGGKIVTAAILDRDYRSNIECQALIGNCKKFCEIIHIHSRKEIENFLLVPEAIDRAANLKIMDKEKRNGKKLHYTDCAKEILLSFAENERQNTFSQYLAKRRFFERQQSSKIDEASFNREIIKEFECQWKIDNITKLSLIPGKEAFSNLNQQLQQRYGISVTPTSIIDAMSIKMVPDEMKHLLELISNLSKQRPGVKHTTLSSLEN